MAKWQAFLDSLNTVGGKMLILLSLIVFIVTVLSLMHILGKDPGEEGKLLVSNAFTAAFSTLLVYLGTSKGNS